MVKQTKTIQTGLNNKKRTWIEAGLIRRWSAGGCRTNEEQVTRTTQSTQAWKTDNNRKYRNRHDRGRKRFKNKTGNRKLGSKHFIIHKMFEIFCFNLYLLDVAHLFELYSNDLNLLHSHPHWNWSYYHMYIETHVYTVCFCCCSKLVYYRVF